MKYDFVTFDCYGTLIDWENGISDAFRQVLPANAFDRTQILDAHAAVEPEVEAETFRSYREVLQETAWRMAQQFHWPLTRADCAFLPESLPSWRAFPDTLAALQRMVRSGLGLGILSNVDDDLLQGTLRQLPVPFEFTITAQQVRSYKPAPGHFDEAAQRLADRKWLHAAGSWFHDIAPCLARSQDAAWINRHAVRAPAGGRPIWVLDDMSELAQRVTAHDG